MSRIESKIARLGLVTTVAFASSACQPSREQNLESDFIYRVSVREMTDLGEPLNGKVLQCFSDSVKVETDSSNEVVIYLENTYCPDKELNKEYLGKSGTQFKSIRLDEMNIGLFRADILNQYESYLKCDLPVPAPFTIGEKTCVE